MYLGRIVEQGPTDAIFDRPGHPYTQALLSAIPRADPRRRTERIALEGDVPSPAEPTLRLLLPPALRQAEARCAQAYPDAHRVGPEHAAACHLVAPAASPR